MTAAGLQEVPLNVNASEPLSTAAQKLGDEHEPREWEIRVNPILMFVGGNT